MKAKWLYIFTLFLCGIFAFPSSSTGARNIKSLAGVNSLKIIKTCPVNPEKRSTGDSPFIRFHHGIDENGVTVSIPNELVISLKPVNDTPEKFAGILVYLSTLSFRLPVTREIYYSTPLRSPPIFS